MNPSDTIILAENPDSKPSRQDESTYIPTYRIFSLIQWLGESPLSLDQINDRLQAECPKGKRVSDDTLWLYLNTLRKLGSEAIRPKPSNDFRYTLASHPFRMNLTTDDILLLRQVRDIAERQWNYSDMLALDACLSEIIRQCLVDYKATTGSTWFKLTRTIDFQPHAELIAQLELACRDSLIAELTYVSPNHGHRRMLLLPKALVYRNGVLYIKGIQAERSDLAMLRVEKILSVRLINPGDANEDSEAVTELLEKERAIPGYVVRLPGMTPGGFDPPDIGEEISYYQHNGEEGAILRGYTRDFFTLKQWLLSCGFAFRIEEPSSLRLLLMETLQRMHAFYLQDGPDSQTEERQPA